MKNRYLLRAKRIDNGEWVEGFYFCMTHPDGRHTHHFIIPLGADLSLGTPIEKIQVEVNPSTICQYTGLRDKNGKLIWENDIVKDNIIYGVVKWENTNVRYIIDDRDDGYQDYSEWWHEVKVIGNAFDNPELLEA